MLYIADCRVTKHEYLNSSKTYSEIQIIEASDEVEAYSKIDKYYNEKSSPYSSYYSVEILRLNGLIK